MSAVPDAAPPARAPSTPRLPDRVAGALRRLAVPRARIGTRAVLGVHLAARAWSDRGRARGLRRSVLRLGFLEAALRTFGGDGMFGEGEAFYPLFLLPDFHGAHFDEALRRLLLPGRGPFAAHLAVTGACPSRCTYCYAAAGGPNPPDLGDERVLAVARALIAKGVPLISLGGGEPLSRFERVVRLVEVLAPSAEVRLATSGVGLDAARAERLKKAGLTALAVSLDSDDAQQVNLSRGYARAFDAAVEALRCSADAGLITLVTSVVDSEGFRTTTDADRFLRFIQTIHPKLIVNFLPKFATGRAASTGGFASPAEYAPVARILARAIREGGYRATVFLDPLEQLMGCVGAGRRQLNVDIRGNVTACISGASFGNLVEEPFDTVYERFRSDGARLKRGFFCASIGDRAGGATVLDAEASFQALAEFYASHPDTLFQKLLDRAGPQLAWLADG